MYIEIIDASQHCPIRCSTCPPSIQRLEGTQTENIAAIFSILLGRLGKIPLHISFVNPLEDIPSKIKQYNITNPQAITCYLPLTSKTSDDLLDMQILSKILPNTSLHLGFTNKNNCTTQKMLEKLVMLGNFYKETALPLVKFSITDNSSSVELFEKNRLAFMKHDAMLYNEIELQTQIRLRSKFMYIKHPKTYFSTAQTQDTQHAFLITRRVMVEVPSNTNKEFVRFAQSYLAKGTINPHELYLTLTPIGIRLFHIAWDIQNPYLWISYEEAFSLLSKSETVRDFCENLITHIHMSLSLKLEDGFPITQSGLEHKASLQKAAKHIS